MRNLLSVNGKRVRNLFRMDLHRMLCGKVFYVMVILAAFIPISTLMQMGDAGSVTALIGGTGAAAGSEMTLSILNMLTAIFLCVFMGKEYSSGFIKNVIPAHANKYDYLISKGLIALICNAVFMAVYLLILFVAGPAAGLSTEVASVPGLILFILEKLLLSIPMSMLIIGVNLVFCRSRVWSVLISFIAAMGVIVMVLQSALQALGLGMLSGILNFTITGAAVFTTMVPSLPALIIVILIAAAWTLICSLAGNFWMNHQDVL